MIQPKKPLLTFSTGTVRILTTPRYHTQCLTLAGTGPTESTEPPTLLEIQFRMVVNDQLNHCLKPRAHMWQMWLGSIKISVQLATQEGQFDLDSMNYLMFLKCKTNFAYQIDIVLTKVEQTFKRTWVQGKVVLHRDGNILDSLDMCQQMVLQLGSENPRQIVCFELLHLQAKAYSSKQKYVSHPGAPNRIRFIDKEMSLPVGIFTSQQQVYSSMGVYSNHCLEELQKVIKELPQHESRNIDGENKLFICHDMKGGYVQDLHFGNNIVPFNTTQNINYRCLHLEQAEIFNYFSHHCLSVPPRHWRTLCKRYGTLCLGTLITEDLKLNEQMLTSTQFALFLVAVARKCQFDGYLINIQRSVGAVSHFKKWLKFLTDKMHQFVPNSKIIWYDSISADKGTIQYQNSLSRKNYQFYAITDGLFTNYWWNQQLLQQSREMKKDSKKKVYIGNDCFGRNTYGGGQLNIFKAVNKINQDKEKRLSVALFAPAWTYESGGSNSRTILDIKQNGMYKGLRSANTNIAQWKMSKAKNGQTGGWNQQGDDIVASFGYNHLYNEKSMVLQHAPLQEGQSARIIFVCLVKSTPPMFNSQYKIILQLRDPFNKVIKATDGVNLNNCRKTGQQSQAVSEHIDVDYSQIKNMRISVKVIVIARSRQNWGGFYGPRFSQQMANVLVYSKCNNWALRMPINQVELGKTYHSYCNTGVGQQFFFQGKALQPSYNFLADMDVPHTQIINSPFETELSYQKAFMGSNCIQVNRENIKLMQMLIPEGIDLKKKYFIVLTVKETANIKLTLKYRTSYSDNLRIFDASFKSKQQTQNGWTRYVFVLTPKQPSLPQSVSSMIELTSNQNPYFLGQIKVISEDKNIDNIKCILRPSYEVLHSDNYYLNLSITSKMYQRLLVVIEQVAMFAYFQDGEALLKSIPVPKADQFTVQIIDTDTRIQTTTIKTKIFKPDSIRDLIFKGSVAF